MSNILLRAIGILAIVFIANRLFGLVQAGQDNTLLLGLGALAVTFSDKIISLLNIKDRKEEKKVTRKKKR